MLNEVTTAEGGIILFIDEMHTLVSLRQGRQPWMPRTS
ncbi:MAG: hypothetical protein R3C16_06755 [Hyphomonadaceae bacterium]